MNRFAFPALSLAIALSACGGESEKTAGKYAPDGAPAKGDVLVLSTIGEASNLIPFIAQDSASHAIAGQIYDGLLKYDKDLNLVGNLAERWTVSDDNLSITFTLKDGVKWADGKPLTAHDVMATYQTIIDPKTITPYSGDFKMVTQAEVLDNLTFKVTYNKPFAPALSSWTQSILPKHKLEGVDINTSELKTTPLGTGPYILEKWESGKDIVLKANPSHFDGEPYITYERTRYIPDSDTQFLELSAGKLDFMGLTPLQFTRQIQTLGKFNSYKYLSNGYTYVGFNLKHPIFKDKIVRQALSYATPRDLLIKAVLMGQGQTLSCPFKPGTWAYNTNIQPYTYNLEKAKSMLTDAGWKDSDGNGILDKEIDGKFTPFSFTLVTNQGNSLRTKTAEILQQEFKKLGIEMKIQTQEWSTFVANTINAKNFEAFILGWSLSPEPDPFDIFHSSKTNQGEFNVVSFSNHEADEMMEKARSTFDQAERKKYLDRFQEILHDEQPYLFLYAPYALVAVHKRIKGLEESPAGLSHNRKDWYVPKEQQIYTQDVMMK